MDSLGDSDTQMDSVLGLDPGREKKKKDGQTDEPDEDAAFERRH